MKKFAHIGICVHSVDAMIDMLRDTLGVSDVSYVDMPERGQRSAYVTVGAETGTSSTSKITIVLNQLLMNKEMFLVIAVFAITTIVVYIIRRLDIDNAWMIAWISGILFETIGLISGYLLLGITGKVFGVIIGGIVSAVIAIALQFMFFNVDYTRTERLQFEDDEYYYYVKAVPKSVITGSQKKVKHFHKNEEKERLTKKKFAQEMDIDEELLD